MDKICLSLDFGDKKGFDPSDGSTIVTNIPHRYKVVPYQFFKLVTTMGYREQMYHNTSLLDL